MWVGWGANNKGQSKEAEGEDGWMDGGRCDARASEGSGWQEEKGKITNCRLD